MPTTLLLTGDMQTPSMPWRSKIKTKGFYSPPFESTVGGTKAGVALSERSWSLERNPLLSPPRLW